MWYVLCSISWIVAVSYAAGEATALTFSIMMAIAMAFLGTSKSGGVPANVSDAKAEPGMRGTCERVRVRGTSGGSSRTEVSFLFWQSSAAASPDMPLSASFSTAFSFLMVSGRWCGEKPP